MGRALLNMRRLRKGWMMGVSDKEKERRRRLARVHMDAERARDIEAIMATFAPNAINSTNGIVITDSATTRLLHEIGGFSQAPGVISDILVVPEVEHFTDYEVVYEGRLRGRHTGIVPGFPLPSNQMIESWYLAVYRFDANDLLVSERTWIDYSGLYVPRPFTPLRTP